MQFIKKYHLDEVLYAVILGFAAASWIYIYVNVLFYIKYFDLLNETVIFAFKSFGSLANQNIFRILWAVLLSVFLILLFTIVSIIFLIGFNKLLGRLGLKKIFD